MIPACKDCGAESVVLFPGSDGVFSDALNAWVLRPVTGFGFCLPHARAHGWPNFGDAQRELVL